MKIKTLPQLVLDDLKLHSYLKPKTFTISKPFEDYILEKITKNVVELKENQEIVCVSIINDNLDIIIIVEDTAKKEFIFYFGENSTDFKVISIPLEETQDIHKAYTYVDISKLPYKLKKYIQACNGNTKKEKITSHRVVASCYYGDITGIEIHHLQYFERTVERPKTSNNAKKLLPVTEDLHIKLFHYYLIDCTTDFDKESILQAGFEARQALENYLFNAQDFYKLEYMSNPEIIKNILLLYFEHGKTANYLAEKFCISRPTILKILKIYRNFTNWCTI